MNISTNFQAQQLGRAATPFDFIRTLNRDRIASALSVVALLALAAWLTALSVPASLPKAQHDAAKDVPPEVYVQRAPNRVLRPAMAAVHLPPPPQFFKQSVAIASSPSTPAAPLQPAPANVPPSLQTPRPSSKKTATSPTITPLAPAKALAPKSIAASPIVQPLTPKAPLEPPVAETVRKPRLFERSSTPKTVARAAEPLVAPTAPHQPPPADLAPSLQPLRLSPEKVTTTPTVTPTAPAKALAPKSIAASPIVQPLAPKAPLEAPVTETVGKPRLFERSPTPKAIARVATLVAPTAPPQPTSAEVAPSLQPLRPSPEKITTMPTITPLTPAKVSIPKSIAASPIVQPLAPKAPPEPPVAETVRKPQLFERSSASKAVARVAKPLVAQTAPELQRVNNKSALQSRAVAPWSKTRELPIHEKSRNEITVAPNRKLLREGRVLLRVLEQGAGPKIEIAWPEGGPARVKLFERFTKCYGMRVALMAHDGKLFTETGQAGRPWGINLDRFSGFARQPAGRQVAEEKHAVRRIRARHTGLHDALPVRVFPRRVDAQLLAGLKRIAGPEYMKNSLIRARYRLSNRTVMVEDIRIDGRTELGRIDLSPTIRSCRRGI